MKDADALMERLSELPPAPSMQSRRQWTKIHLLSSHWLILGFVGNRTKCRSSKSKVYIYIRIYHYCGCTDVVGFFEFRIFFIVRLAPYLLSCDSNWRGQLNEAKSWIVR